MQCVPIWPTAIAIQPAMIHMSRFDVSIKCFCAVFRLAACVLVREAEYAVHPYAYACVTVVASRFLFISLRTSCAAEWEIVT